jgi:hypothetical protein
LRSELVGFTTADAEGTEVAQRIDLCATSEHPVPLW